MTTQELKQYIDKVLGNNLRCLLPSYWWKRLFTSLADRVDEVEQSTSKLIETKVNEVKMPIVESVDELNKLDLPNGSVAAVKAVGEPKVINPADCYNTSVSTIQQNWDKLTIIKAIEYKDNVPKEWVDIVYMATYNGGENNQVVVGQVDGRLLCVQGIDGEKHRISLQKVNELLASEEYRIFVCNPENSELAFTLYSEIPHPELYIKGNSWERLAKESDLEGMEGGSADARPVLFYAPLSENESLDDTLKAKNVEAYNKVIIKGSEIDEKVFDIKISAGGLMYFDVLSYCPVASNNTIRLIFYNATSDIASLVVSSDGNVVFETEKTVDTELSDTSENAVQNKVVKAYVDNAIANAITTTLNTAV